MSVEPPSASSERPERLRRWSAAAYAGVAAALLLMAVLALVTLQLQDAVLSYVKGESLWSKAQKEAVIALEDYARTGDPAAWNDYRNALEVPLGDRQARLALQQEPPDPEEAREGFLQGGLDPGEVDGMIRLFRWFGDWGPMAESIEHWTAGDSLIAELEAEADELRTEWQSPPPDTAVISQTIARIEALNAELSEREQRFTAAVDRASDVARRWSQGGIAGLTVLLLVTAGGLAWKIYRMFRDHEESLRRSEQRYRHLFEHNVAGIYRSRPDGAILDCNPAFAEMLGFESVEEAIGTPGDELFPSPETRRQNNRQLLEDGELRNHAVRLHRRDGTPIWVLANAVVVEDDGESPVIHGTMVDITDRKRAEERYRRLFEQSVTGVFRSEHEDPGRILECNEAFAEMFGFDSPKEAVGTRDAELYPSEEERSRAMEDIREGGRTFQQAFEMRRRDGTPVWVMGETRLVDDPELGAVNEGLMFDVSDRVEARRELAEREERFRQMAESIEEVFWLRDPENEEMLYVSPAYEDIWGRPTEELCREPDSWLEAIHSEDRERVREAVFGSPGWAFEEEYRIVRPDGEVRWVHDQGFRVEGETTSSRRVAGVARDITEQKKLEDELRYQALHDPLTGLANRTLLSDRIEQGLARAGRREKALGLLMLDIDQFKRINDRLGHTAGDRVLTELARRLRNAVREEDTVARWGGDEFAVVLPELVEPESVLELRERLYDETVRAPIDAGGESIHVDLSIGAVVHSEQDHRRAVRVDNVEEFLRFGSLALHWAKEEAPRGFRVFDPRGEIEGSAQIRREREFRKGLEQGEFIPHYQPIVRLDDGSMVDIEVLARWRHPERGFVPPGEFVPLAEELGLIGPLENAIVRQACRTVAEWDERFAEEAPLRVRVNVSAQQFGDRDMAREFRNVVKDEGCRPEQITLEVTETSLMRIPARIAELRQLGFRVSIDDFGTGYSTFTYLRDLEVDELKIDISFVQGITDSDSDAALVETMVSLGNRLGLDVIAEGIETEGQRRRLQDLGCSFGQGFLFARPLPGDELARQWLDGSNGGE